MDIKLLGPLSAELNSVSIAPNAGKPRQLLSLLAMNANQVLPVPTLMEEIWGTEMPRSALTTLQTYILQLRRLLTAALGPEAPAGAKDVLVTRHGGYLLRVPQGSVDVHEYERLVAAGRQAFDNGEDEAASAAYDEALSMWHGPALVDVRIGPILEIELARLEESRLGALERRIESDLRLGRHSQLLAELTTLIGRHPLHENLHAQCMTALYRSGRRWRALEVYQGLRGRLVEELGLEPSAHVRSLHQAILAADPSLDAPGTGCRPLGDLHAA
ncbi:DNA-binding SARP family transcriptional activator [Streptomyces sp. V4I23]|uniref:AfsR/SARP family transcriptional regulator n=1 Tax=Streptomyces sp. V4I23 TaxID=3042282 RepID=UPI002786B28F|nr:AfsR/SARP family transcriptional regulator [Streptomyces sp. V4I23]MDQ1008573.1 DNA-binding SARP family transcriptional activator [Streptomyces sp. V4I23]